MAQHVLNFTEPQFEHDQTPPAGFTVRWVTSGAWDIRHLPGNPAYIGGAGVRWSGSGNARRALSLDVTATGKVHVIVPVRSPSSVSGTTLGVLLAGAGSASSETGYAWVLVDGNTFRLNRYSGGSVTNHESTSFAHVAGTHYWIEAEYDPSTDTTRARVWADGSEPPETWQGEFTDGSPLSDGWLGFFTFTAEVRGYSSLFVGTAGDAAPRQPAAPPQPFVTFRGASAIIARAEDDYSHPDASAWTASRFRILDDADTVLETSSEVAKAAGLPEHTFFGLDPSTDYQLQVQHKDAEGEWSGWSLARPVTTLAEGGHVIAGASLIGLSGNPPPDWTLHIPTNWFFSGSSGNNDSVRSGSGVGGQGTAEWDIPPTVTNYGRVRARVAQVGFSQAAVTLRSTGDRTGYEARSSRLSDWFRLYRGETQLATMSFSPGTGQRDIELEIWEEGGETKVRGRIWTAGTAPPDWMLTFDDDNGARPMEGFAGLAANDHNTDWYEIEVEAEGEPPEPPPPPPLPDPIAPGWKLYRTTWRGPNVRVRDITTTSAEVYVDPNEAPAPAFPTADEWIGSYIESETWVHDAEATALATYVVDTIASDGSLTRLKQWTGVKGAANGVASFSVLPSVPAVPVGVLEVDPVDGLQRLDLHRGESQTFTATEGNRIASFPPQIERMAVNTVAGAWYRVVYQTPDEPLVSPAFELGP